MKYVGSQPVGWDGHLMLLYQAETQRRAGVSSWVRRGLDLGSKILYTEPAQPPPDRSLQEVLQDLPEVHEALARGQIEVVPAHETAYDPAWQASVVEQALDEGYPSVRWTAEATTAWAHMPRERHADVERATDDLCRSQPLSVMCQYAVQESMDYLDHACGVHGAGLRERLFRAAPFSGGLVFAGEIDRSNNDIASSLLSAATSMTERDEFVVDLQALDFLDVQGARTLVSGTAGYRDRGGQVRLLVTGPPVDSVIRLLGVDRTPGILVEGE